MSRLYARMAVVVLAVALCTAEAKAQQQGNTNAVSIDSLTSTTNPNTIHYTVKVTRAPQWYIERITIELGH